MEKAQFVFSTLGVCRWVGWDGCAHACLLGLLLQVSPSGQWSKDRCQLRWEVGRILPGQEGLLRAVVPVKQGATLAAALAAAQKQAVARVLFTGQRGRTLSGLGFEAGMEEDGAEFMPCGMQYFGEVSVRP